MVLNFYLVERNCIKIGQFVEIRIPYLLLNIMDPSTKTPMANFKDETLFKVKYSIQFLLGLDFKMTVFSCHHLLLTLPVPPYLL